MAVEEHPSKNDINTIFNKLRSIPANKACFDCGAKNPTWSSITYGVFICIDCSAVHRSLGVHISFVRSTQLDINWTWGQIRAMQISGNANAHSYFQSHNCITQDAQQKYNSRAAILYREKLSQMVAQSIRIQGPSLDIGHQPTSPHAKQSDFWSEHQNENSASKSNDYIDIPEISDDKRSSPVSFQASLSANAQGPKVNLSNEQKDNKEYKPSLLSKKTNKKGIGARKGLGAQKVNADFSKIEEAAIKNDEIKDGLAKKELTEEEVEQQFESMQQAYEDLGEKQRKTEEKLRNIDPSKAQQLERLGIGFFNPGDKKAKVSHSAISDMKVIEQSNPTNHTQSRNHFNDLDKDFMMLDLGFSSNSSKYKEDLFPKKDNYEIDDFWSEFEKPYNKKPEVIDSIEVIDLNHTSRSKSKSVNTSDKKPSVTTNKDAQSKFGNAKSISSDQYFGINRDSDYENRTKLAQFEGSKSISSDAYFGKVDNTRNNSGFTSSLSGANFYDIKEGVKDGVTKVAGKLSSLATDVMSSIQEKYGS